MVIAVAGNIDHGEVVRLVRRAFRDEDGTGAAPAQNRRPQPARAPASPVRVLGDDTEQANLLLGGYGLSRYDERRFALGVLSAAIGGGSSSRLFQKIREERGLAYSVYSFTTAFSDTGHFGVYAGCQPAKAEEVLGLMHAELGAVADGRLDEDEIERGKGQMRGALVLGLEDSGARMTRIGKSELIYGDVLGLDELLERIDAVTAADVAAVAEDVLHRPRCLTVVGPFGEHDFDGLL
jgi:predicted Zn-dependent peptidase